MQHTQNKMNIAPELESNGILKHKTSNGKSYHSTLNSVNQISKFKTKIYKNDELEYEYISNTKNGIDVISTKIPTSSSSKNSGSLICKNSTTKSTSINRKKEKTINNFKKDYKNEKSDNYNKDLENINNRPDSGISISSQIAKLGIISRAQESKTIDKTEKASKSRADFNLKEFSNNRLKFSKISRAPLKLPALKGSSQRFAKLGLRSSRVISKKSPAIRIKIDRNSVLKSDYNFEKNVSAKVKSGVSLLSKSNEGFNGNFSLGPNVIQETGLKQDLPSNTYNKREYFNVQEAENNKLKHFFKEEASSYCSEKKESYNGLIRRSTIAACDNSPLLTIHRNKNYERPEYNFDKKGISSFNKKNITKRSFLFNTALAEYRQVKPLGKGSYGRVDLMENIVTKNLFAVKTIKRYSTEKHTKSHPEYKKATTLDKRVIREANLGLVLGQTHPHITALYDLRMTNTHFYMFYEYVKGPTLAERVGENGIDESEARELFKPIAETISKFS
ncbi:Serine/threonine-protein kinase KIN2 [Smittium culicis]|uniref:Serine/threonine-protein kinase KIN2 n=1 Tax=Smittium culicis TaxID=133412 RepID=A0A1R1XZ46_9FUNG|nr:Serine/threonine-protein kinase KIN2 [Smittium culicis]OMJ19794.1 Serine/threonine-protein kinase KIN2 [Smittium culicis]